MSDGVPKWLVVVGAVLTVAVPVGSVVANYVSLDVSRQSTQTHLEDLKQRVRAVESDQSVKKSVEQLTTQVALLQWQVEQLTEQLRETRQQRRQ
jgi:hypothetical protein